MTATRSAMSPMSLSLAPEDSHSWKNPSKTMACRSAFTPPPVRYTDLCAAGTPQRPFISGADDGRNIVTGL